MDKIDIKKFKKAVVYNFVCPLCDTVNLSNKPILFKVIHCNECGNTFEITKNNNYGNKGVDKRFIS
jgi:transcription elongation factor Elf1